VGFVNDETSRGERKERMRTGGNQCPLLSKERGIAAAPVPLASEFSQLHLRDKKESGGTYLIPEL